MSTFATALRALPDGTFRGRAHGRSYIVTKTRPGDGRITKLVAEELGGSDYVSLNHFELASGSILKPCEMPAKKVTAFVLDLTPDP